MTNSGVIAFLAKQVRWHEHQMAPHDPERVGYADKAGYDKWLYHRNHIQRLKCCIGHLTKIVKKRA